VACTTLDGRPIAVTGGGVGMVWIWDLSGREEIDRVDLPGSCQALALGAGGVIVAGIGWDITRWLRQLTSGSDRRLAARVRRGQRSRMAAEDRRAWPWCLELTVSNGHSPRQPQVVSNKIMHLARP